MATKFRPKYTIRSIAPGLGYKGVWTHEVDGGLKLETWSIDFVGVADLRVHHDGRWVDEGPEIVAITLTDGFFDVVDGQENFHGIVPAEASWQQCFELVPPDRQKQIAKVVEPGVAEFHN